MNMIGLLTLICLVVNLALSTAQEIGYCLAWGDPHVTRFPRNLQERGIVGEVWCQETGPQWLIKNKYVAATIHVSAHPYLITDFDIVIYRDDGTIACSFNNRYPFSETPSCADGVNMIYLSFDHGFTFSYIDAELSLTVSRYWWGWSSVPYYYNVQVGQSMCMIKVSEGLCKTGCDPMTGAILRGRRSATTQSPAQLQVVQKANEICDIYLNNFLRRISNTLTEHEIANARHSCIIDLTETGRTEMAQSMVGTLAIEVASSNATSISDLATELNSNLAQIATVVNNSFVQSNAEVQQILDPVINNSTVLRWSLFETSNNACRMSNRTYAADPYLSAYALLDSLSGCGPVYARSLLTLGEVDRVPVNRPIISATLSLFGTTSTESTQAAFQTEIGRISVSNVLVQRVTSSWSSATTYLTRPSTTTVNQVIIPGTSLRDGYNVTIDITNLVRDMRNAGQSSFGIQLILQTESRYRLMTFCSPTHLDVTRHPKLTLVT